MDDKIQVIAKGIMPDETGVCAVKELLSTRNIKEVETFIGKVNYCNNFIPNFSEILAAINQLREKNARFI